MPSHPQPIYDVGRGSWFEVPTSAANPARREWRPQFRGRPWRRGMCRADGHRRMPLATLPPRVGRPEGERTPRSPKGWMSRPVVRQPIMVFADEIQGLQTPPAKWTPSQGRAQHFLTRAATRWEIASEIIPRYAVSGASGYAAFDRLGHQDKCLASARNPRFKGARCAERPGSPDRPFDDWCQA